MPRINAVFCRWRTVPHAVHLRVRSCETEIIGFMDAFSVFSTQAVISQSGQLSDQNDQISRATTRNCAVNRARPRLRNVWLVRFTTVPE